MAYNKASQDTSRQIGDILLYEGLVWKVSHIISEFGTVLLVDPNRNRKEVPKAELGTDSVLMHRSKNWPYVILPGSALKNGYIQAMVRDGKKLALFNDWVPEDMYRGGGSIYFNPALKFKLGDVLVALHVKEGKTTKINITKNFGTFKQRKVKKAWKPPTPLSTFDKLMQSDYDD